MKEFEYGVIKEATNNFSSSLIIGKGSHGCVYKGILKEQHGNQIVAIKKQSQGLSKLQDNSKIDNEANILSSLPQSPHLIKLLGTSHDFAKNKLLVMEHMPNGTLHHLLFETSTPFPWTKRVEIALQIARGVQILHESEPLIIHRDIKSTNILFDSDWNAKLADFGLAVRYDEENRQINSLSRPSGTIGYLDPYYTTPCKLSTQNDVFSFGIVLLEIISGTKAIDVSRVPSSIAEWASPLIEKHKIEQICDKRLELSTSMKATISHMIRVASLCVSLKEDHRRPSMQEIVMEMEIRSIECNKIHFWANIWFTISKGRRKMISRRKNKIVATAMTTTTTCVVHRESNYGEFSKGKIMLLRDVLANVTY